MTASHSSGRLAGARFRHGSGAVAPGSGQRTGGTGPSRVARSVTTRTRIRSVARAAPDAPGAAPPVGPDVVRDGASGAAAGPTGEAAATWAPARAARSSAARAWGTGCNGTRSNRGASEAVRRTANGSAALVEAGRRDAQDVEGASLSAARRRIDGEGDDAVETRAPREHDRRRSLCPRPSRGVGGWGTVPVELGDLRVAHAPVVCAPGGPLPRAAATRPEQHARERPADRAGSTATTDAGVTRATPFTPSAQPSAPTTPPLVSSAHCANLPLWNTWPRSWSTRPMASWAGRVPIA